MTVCFDRPGRVSCDKRCQSARDLHPSPLTDAQSGPLSSMVQSASETGAVESSAASDGFEAGALARL